MLPVEVYLLAAGVGERMGASKPLLKFGKTTVLGAMAKAFREAGLRKLRVIGRKDDAELAQVTFDLGARYIFNLEPQRGMSGSILEAMEDCESDWLCVCPADMPLLQSATLTKCTENLFGNVVQPICENRRRHPAFLNISLRFELRAFLQEGGNLRQFLHEKHINTVEAEPCWQFSDIDTPEDYERILKRQPW